jgi:PTS system mannose-specific IIA component
VTGILVVTHGRLSESLVETARMFASDTEGVESVCFLEGQGVEDLTESVKNKLSEMDSFESILCFVDMQGGSPARVLGEQVFKNPKIELITGVNLPLLVEAIVSRKVIPREKLVEYLMDVSKNSISNVGEILRA